MDPTLTANDFASIARNIQLAIAPVFLIAGVGALLNVLTNRLARVVDRGRTLERELSANAKGPLRQSQLAELAGLDTRMVRISRAILLATLSILLICVVIVVLFTGELIQVDLSSLIAALFIAAMIALIGGLVSFLGEIGIATRSLRVAHEYRRKRD
jgi:hypothetical protein